MFYNAKNNNIKIEQSNMDYVSFGVGNKNLIIIRNRKANITKDSREHMF